MGEYQLKIGLLQLSDIHLQVASNSIMEKINKINSAIKSEVYSLDYVFVIFSGDIAFSGKTEEYEIGMSLVDNIVSYITKQLKKRTSTIIIPGNHDCDFTMDDGVRKALVEKIESLDYLDQSVINQLCKPQKNYFDFSEMYSENDKTVIDNELVKRYEYNIEGFTISINCLNTSWVSQLHEKPGQMYFPIHMYKRKLQPVSDLNITVLHHPYNWYIPENGRIIREVIESCSDTVLTGHEHISSYKNVKEYRPDRTISVDVIEGGALQENNNSDISEFNLLKYDLSCNHQKIIKFKWIPEKNQYNPMRPIIISDFKNPKKMREKFYLNQHFRSFLNDIGFEIYHPQITKSLQLDDVYVYPEAREIRIKEKNKEVRKYVNLEKIFACERIGKVLIIGDEKYGKTSLCKQLYKTSLSLNLVPVYIKGEELSDYQIDGFNKVLYKNFTGQYSKEVLEDFKQLQDDKKIIIIDDINKAKLNKKFLGKLINNIGEIYSNTLITADRFFNLSELIKSEFFMLSEYEEYQLVEFGHKARMVIINKWNSLGLESQLEEKDLILKNDEFERTIDTILGRHFVPASPFFILIILQTIENGQSSYLRESTLGHYYEYLIRQPFILKHCRNDEIETLYTYISELAYNYFKNKEEEKTDSSLREFNRFYCDTYQLALDFNDTKEKLKVLNILQENENGYVFKYKYVYYFFVARFFSSNIDDPFVKNVIRKMCKELFINENADILMFLTHHSKNPFILDELLTNAKGIFEDIAPADLNVEPINKLIEEVPRIIYRNTDVVKNRERKNELEDRLDRTANLDEKPVVLEKKRGSQEGTYNQLDLAFNSINIIGQILKNYYGSIKGNEKLKLGEEIYSLGLRALNVFLQVMDENMELIVTKVEGVIRINEINNKTDIDKLARRIIFNVCCLVVFAFIKKISAVIGTRNLEKTFQQILCNNDTFAVNLIDLAIKLDFFRKIPMDQLKSFTDRLNKSKNYLSLNILRQLVVEHLYMFEVNFQDKQRICSYLGIPIDTQRSIGLLKNNHQK